MLVQDFPFLACWARTPHVPAGMARARHAHAARRFPPPQMLIVTPTTRTHSHSADLLKQTSRGAWAEDRAGTYTCVTDLAVEVLPHPCRAMEGMARPGHSSSCFSPKIYNTLLGPCPRIHMSSPRKPFSCVKFLISQ